MSTSELIELIKFSRALFVKPLYIDDDGTDEIEDILHENEEIHLGDLEQIKALFERKIAPTREEQEINDEIYDNILHLTFPEFEQILVDIITPPNYELKAIILEDTYELAEQFINKKPLPPKSFKNILSAAISIGNYTLKYGSMLIAPNETAFTIFEIVFANALEDSNNINKALEQIESLLKLLSENIEKLEALTEKQQQIQDLLEKTINIKQSKNRAEQLQELRELIELIKSSLEAVFAPASFINTQSQKLARSIPEDTPRPLIQRG